MGQISFDPDNMLLQKQIKVLHKCSSYIFFLLVYFFEQLLVAEIFKSEH